MYDDASNVGVLFNHLPKLFLKANEIESDADCLVKVMRAATGDALITSDHQLFRRMRENSANVDPEAFLKRYPPNWADFKALFEQSLPELEDGISFYGAWFCVKQQVMGIEQSLAKDVEISPSERDYFQFIYAHVEQEKQFIQSLAESQDTSQLKGILKDWLMIEMPTDPHNAKEACEYTTCLVLYWAALLELWADMSPSRDAIDFRRYLPSYSPIKKGWEVMPSTEAILLDIKKRVARVDYGKEDIKWTELYRRIVRAQLTKGVVSSDENDKEHPDIESVKKCITRWRKGKLISSKLGKQYLGVLEFPADKAEETLPIFTRTVINLFTLIQLEWLRIESDPKNMVETFSRYHEYKALVTRRFEHFQTHSELVK
ncbi:hypothetical protein EHW61_15085 [Salinivibrio sp. VYel6]|uniref:hypothetical protein n=1 Tax=Salinivibrio sp. VYel6 TaxID=2490493 RepID=UPI00128DED2C|nr:hypothetical protein [Salinivibrio sp. VYel6]MPX97963.1 hypothetical protein [Salinivibrio sp. VYel6]